jgi:hypothetical protein
MTKENEQYEKRHRRHPLFGWMKGTVVIAPGVDLTEPACPEPASIVEESWAKMQEPGKAEDES